jgi:hypothetical protein
MPEWQRSLVMNSVRTLGKERTSERIRVSTNSAGQQELVLAELVNWIITLVTYTLDQ